MKVTRLCFGVAVSLVVDWPTCLYAFSLTTQAAWKTNHDPTIKKATINNNNNNVPTQECVRPHIIFPGGGLYFYWQAGVITFLREQGYDLSCVTMAGASAGALTATLTATNVDFYEATEVALNLSEELGVWDRSLGLQGVWGQAIYEWMEHLLPENAVELAQHCDLTLQVTDLATFQKVQIQQFTSRMDLIQCNMASIHIPWFLDGKLTTEFRGQHCIDGSFWIGREWFVSNRPDDAPTLVLDHLQDPVLKSKTLWDAVSLLSPDGVRDLLEQGKRHAVVMEKNGMFQRIRKVVGAS